MTGDDYAYLFYMTVILVLVGSTVVYQARGRLSQTLQNALIWVGIFAILIIGYGFRDVLQRELFPGQTLVTEGGAVTLTRARDGAFYADLVVNGQDVRFAVDTGASLVVLTKEDAERAGIDTGALAFTGRAQTANGVVNTASVRLDTVRFGSITDRNIRASVNGGDLFISLLGMSYLNRFARIEIRGDQMILER